MFMNQKSWRKWGFLLVTGCLSFISLLAEAPGGTLIVLNKSDATASFISLKSGQTTTTLPTGEGPHEVAVSSDGRLAVVSNYGGKPPGNSLTVFDISKHRTLKTISLAEYKRPHGIVFLKGDSSVLVTAESRKSLVKVNLNSGKIIGVYPTEQKVSHMVTLTPDQKFAFVANIGSGSVSVINLISGKLLKIISTGKGAEGIATTPDGTEVWVTNREADAISVISVKDLKVKDTIACGEFPIRIKFTPDGKLALVSCARSGEVAVINRRQKKIVHRISMKLQAKKDTESRLFKNVFGESPVPIGILIHPDGVWAYVANTNADAVAVINLKTREVVKFYPTGKQPDGLGFSALE